MKKKYAAMRLEIDKHDLAWVNNMKECFMDLKEILEQQWAEREGLA